MGWSESHISLAFQWYMTFTPPNLQKNFADFFLSVVHPSKSYPWPKSFVKLFFYIFILLRDLGRVFLATKKIKLQWDFPVLQRTERITHLQSYQASLARNETVLATCWKNGLGTMPWNYLLEKTAVWNRKIP